MITALLVAHAAAPVVPVAAPSEIAALHRAAGRPEPRCTTAVPKHVEVCFRQRVDGRRRWLTATDPDPLPAVRREASARLDALLETAHVAGMPPSAASRYRILRDAEGWAATAVLAPEALVGSLGGGRVRVAVPTTGIAFAWADPAVSKLTEAQGAALDHILAVAVRETYDPADDAVSPTVFVWNGKALEPFVTARARTPEGEDPR